MTPLYVVVILVGCTSFNTAVNFEVIITNEILNNDDVRQKQVVSDVIQMNDANINDILAKHELVLINFYVDWCQFSNFMQPIFEDATKLVYQEFGKSGRVAMGRVDCDIEIGIAKRFQIIKYPTLKISLNGDVMKKEYRGQRTPEAIAQYVREQLKDPIKEVTHLDELKDLNSKKRFVVAYFNGEHSVTSSDYLIYRKVATNLKDDCDFYAVFGENVPKAHARDNLTIVFHPDTAFSNQPEEIYNGAIHADELTIWTRERCIPLVREITFENAEELTEEGMPFMILFYHPENANPIKDYKSVVEAELLHEKQNVNFLIADGKKFLHPLQHIGKTLDDLPVIVIDTFRHMYIFNDFNDIYRPGKLKKFVDDLHSGKLHREYHYGSDLIFDEIIDALKEQFAMQESEHEQAHDRSIEMGKEKSTDSIENEIKNANEMPPESTFIKLAPSDKRYTLIKNEL